MISIPHNLGNHEQKMVTRKEIVGDNVARMPTHPHLQQSSNKSECQIPSSTFRILRPKHQYNTINNDTWLCTPNRTFISVDDIELFVTPTNTATCRPNSDRKLSPKSNLSLKQEMTLPPLNRKMPGRRPLQRKKSRDSACDSVSRSSESKVHRNEADFLIKNQEFFTREDFEQILLVLAEESRMDEKRKLHEAGLEAESLKLAQELASKLETPPHRKRASSSDDLEALVVALRAEIDETDNKRKNEEESFRLACLLVEEEVQQAHYSERRYIDDCEHAVEKEEEYSDLDEVSTTETVQCHACYLNIENEESIRELRCGHQFHSCCINRWLLMNKKTCPYCRQSL